MLNDPRRSQKFAAVARQHVALTGLNLEFFNDTLEGLARVHRFFQDSLPFDALEPFQIPTTDGFSILTSHTRYFTPRRNCCSPIIRTFGPNIDPNGDLESLKGHNYVHTEDNIVQYLYEKKTSNETSCVIILEKFFVEIYSIPNLEVITTLTLSGFKRETSLK
jgi:hypothetical protein